MKPHVKRFVWDTIFCGVVRVDTLHIAAARVQATGVDSYLLCPELHTHARLEPSLQ